jgi:hypothetical protein
LNIRTSVLRNTGAKGEQAQCTGGKQCKDFR